MPLPGAAPATPQDLALVEQLRGVLAERPDDLQGHRLLARSLGGLGRWSEARAAQGEVVRILGPAATGQDLAEWAELMVLATNGYVSPEAEQALGRALSLDPGNPLARYYSGLTVLQGGRPDLAYRLWTGLLAEGPADAPWIATIEGQIDEVARLAGLPPPGDAPPGPSPADVDAAGAMTPDERQAMVAGMVDQLGTRLAAEGGTRRGMGATDPRPRRAGPDGRSGGGLDRRAGGQCRRSGGARGAGGGGARGGADQLSGAVLEDIRDFAAALAPGRALIGLDLGEKTIGVAVSDTYRRIATPLETIRRAKFTADAAALLAIAEARGIGGLVLGLPRNMDGTEGPRAQSTRAFARNLSRLSDLPITFWDERLSTVAAERALLEADTSRNRRAQVIDHVAAGYILQGLLDRLGHLGREGA